PCAIREPQSSCPVNTVADAESLAHSHDIISIGVLADDLRRRRHGTRTTFVRVANVAADVGAPVSRPAAAGEVRIAGVPGSRAAAVERVRAAASAAGRAALTGCSRAA